MLVDKTVTDFLLEVASKSPAPGGGSVSALGGATSASLLSMVCNLTIGKKRYAAVEERMRGYLSKATGLQQTLTSLVDRDTQAFNDLMKAYRTEQGEGETEARRESAIAEALDRCIHVPLEVAETCVELLHLAVLVAQEGNTNSITDTGVAVLFADAGLTGALYNVRINLGAVPDPRLRETYSRTIASLAETGKRYKEQALVEVEARLKS